MLFDGLLLLTALILAVNGWHRGLIRSWRGPIAMIIATIVVQQFYVDFATWIVSRLKVSPETAVVLGYLISWFSLEAVLEILLSMFIKDAIKSQPVFFDRLGGVAYGLFKAVVIATLPLMAICAEIKVPEPPPDKSGLKIPGLDAAHQAVFMPGFKKLAESLLPALGNYVVSDKEPSFTPVFDTVKNEETQQVKDTRKTEQEIQNLLK
jgi:uncharacterized membrane protein required for colicin V production